MADFFSKCVKIVRDLRLDAGIFFLYISVFGDLPGEHLFTILEILYQDLALEGRGYR
jgi:hypothetical protein